MTTLTIYRAPATEIVTFDIDEKTVLSKHLKGEHKITSEFINTSVIALQIGDFITYDSQNFYINRLPDIEKINSSTFKYKITFESDLYELGKKLFMSSDELTDFSYNGTASDFITMIVNLMNVIGSGWTAGTVDSSDAQTLTFNNESCNAALSKITEAFKMEFSLSGKELSLLNSVGTTKNYTFRYGKDLGLYKIERQQIQNQNIITKCYGFGGTKNIPADYRTRAKRLVFESAGNRYLTKNTALYGTIEGQFTDDNIYPKRTSTLTDVNMVFDFEGTGFNNRTSYIEDSTIDFDINDYLIEGLTAKVVFKSGDLSGVECEIWKYDNANKRIYINPSTDRDGYTQPFYNSGSPVIPATGDSYTFIDMEMPTAYVTVAETALLAATQAYIDKYSVPQCVYTIEIDPKYAADISLSLDAGDRVTIVDSDLGINALIRTSGIEFPLVNPYKIKALIADFVPYTVQERLYDATKANKQNILTVNKTAEELARLNNLKLHQEKAKNTVPMYQGAYASGTTYYGNPSRIDIVKYNIPDDSPDAGEIYFIARVDAPSESFSGIVPTNTDYWKRFDAQYSSIATQLLFAELAYIDNLGVKYFNGVPVPVGDLAGSVVNTRANRAAVQKVYRVTKTAYAGDCAMVIDGFTQTMLWNTNEATTVSAFVTAHASDFGAVTLTDNSNGTFDVTANVAGVDFTIADDPTNYTHTILVANVTALARIDTITLNVGTSGTANILCSGVTKVATFVNNYTETAAAFVALWAADYLASGVIITSSGADIICTASVPGVDFTGTTTIGNVANFYRGSIKIQGNEIWENAENNDDYGYITINRIGYNGGTTKGRHFLIGNGKGRILVQCSPSGGQHGTIILYPELLVFPNIPTSNSGLSDGFIYRDGSGPDAVLKIK